MSTAFLDLACLLACLLACSCGCRFLTFYVLGRLAPSVDALGVTFHLRLVGGVFRKLGGASAASRGTGEWSCVR